MSKIPFAPPRIDQEIIDEVVDTLKSGWITTGPKTKLFERRLKEYIGVPAAICLNSATAGLEVILRWFGVKEGDEVILPAYTYAATANVIIHCGATPVFVDVRGADFNIDLETISKAITERSKVIMPVDFGGLPCDYDEINDLVTQEKYLRLFQAENTTQEKLGRILVLSDSAHSIGAEYKGKKAGSLTDISVFSFHAVKNLTTAEGGAIMLNLPPPFSNQSVYEELAIKILHGQNKDALLKLRPGSWRYDIVEAGYKYNMTDIAASIGLVELGRYERDTLIVRASIVTLYISLLKEYDWAILPVFRTANKTSSFHLFPLRIKGINEELRDLIIKKISEKAISVNVHFIPVPMMSFYRKLGYNIEDYPESYKCYANEISLPVFYGLSEDQIKLVVSELAKVIEEVLRTTR